MTVFNVEFWDWRHLDHVIISNNIYFPNCPEMYLIFLVLNVVVADACKKFWIDRNKSFIRKLLALTAVGHLVANAAFSMFMVVVSSQNYPG